MGKRKKIIIISAVNFREGGPLTILRNLLDCLNQSKYRTYNIVSFVSNKNLFLDYPNIKFLEFPNIKKNWLNRIIFEYIRSYFISKRISPHLWFSMHDITPNVLADKQIVYCHNPSPFYRLSINDVIFDFKFTLFSLFYRYLYQINISKNNFVIVQQNWIKKKFIKFVESNKILVCRPSLNLLNQDILPYKKNQFFTIFYPSFPRTFKNFELICLSIEMLPENIRTNIILEITINGRENIYSSYIYERFKKNINIHFIGLQKYQNTLEHINRCDLFVFPSKIETFGLPILEAIHFKKNMFVADLPYAYEACDGYDKVKFINPFKPKVWSECIVKQFESYKYGLSNSLFSENSKTSTNEKNFEGWDSMIDYIIE